MCIFAQNVMNIKESIANKVSSFAGVAPEDVLGLFETPPSPDKGDIALPCFKLAKALRKAPQMIAQELSGIFSGFNGIVKAEPAGGYLNFFLDSLFLLVCLGLVDSLLKLCFALLEVIACS